MVRCLPRSRVGRVAAGTAIGGLGLLLLPPKEHLPTPLLSVRVLLEGTGRVLRCAAVGAAILVDYHWSLRGIDNQEAWNAVHERCARRLVRLAEENGGLYVKAGQIFANMNHVLPPVYCTIMASLQDAVMSRPFEEIAAVLKQDLGPEAMERYFEFIDPTPLAAASLAQVHRARRREAPRQGEVCSSWAAYTKSSTASETHQERDRHAPFYSRDVAIKVQYVDIARRFRGDMAAIDMMLSVAGWMYPGYDLSEIIRKLQSTVAAELDFRLEAANCERAARELRQAGFGNEVVCPTIHHDLQSPRILIMNYVDGVKINDKAGMEALGIRPQQAVGRFIDAVAFQMFASGFFHADPHAGNVLVQPMPRRVSSNGEEEKRCEQHQQQQHKKRPKTQQGQVVLLDYGLCGVLTPAQREEFGQIWVAAVTHDDAMLKRIAARYGPQVNYELLASCFLQHPYALHSLSSGGGRLTGPEAREAMRTTMKEKMHEVNDIVSSLPKDYALLLRSIMATKAINRDMGDVVNRPQRFLKYALDASKESTPWWRRQVIYAKARLMGCYASTAMALLKWWHPEMFESIESSLQVSG
eukprot:gene11391-7896_t